MKPRLLTLAACLLVSAVPTAHAESSPVAVRYDARIKTVDFNASNVVRIVGHFGYSTDIEFSPGESIVSVALGDSLAWAVAPVENHIFVKPREPHATTNMTVITNKRVYQFALIGDPARSEPRRDFDYLVRFEYPRTLAARKTTAANAAAVQAALDVNDKPRNWDYYGCGPDTIRPTQVYDDGRFTYFTFPAAMQVPAIYYVDQGSQESLTNGQMRGDQFVVFGTARQFVLRRGNTVGCVENRAYNPYGVYTPTGTTSPDVERVLKASASVQPAPTRTLPPAAPPKAQPSPFPLPAFEAPDSASGQQDPAVLQASPGTSPDHSGP